VKRAEKEGAIKTFITKTESKAFAPLIILERIPPHTPAYSEEFFGPVFNLFESQSDLESIQIANDTQYGLGAAVFSKDPQRALKVASKIDSGMVFVNNLTRSDARLPYGGVKCSGMGRDSGHEAIKEFANVKTYWVD